MKRMHFFAMKSKAREKRMYIQCNKSGFYHEPINRKRHLKIQGSRKINTECPERIRAYIEEYLVNVNFFKNHLGHGMEIKHLQISEDSQKNSWEPR